MTNSAGATLTGGAKKIEFGPRLADLLEDGYLAPSTRIDGGARSAIFRPAHSEIWCVEARLDAAAALSWTADHGEEIVHVLDGRLEFEGHACPPGSAVILEAGVPATLTAAGDAQVLHFGGVLEPPSDGPFGPPASAGRAVRVIGPGGLAEYVEPGRVARYWADGSAETCRVTLFSSKREGPAVQPAHSHSVDEIFMIAEGSIVVGKRHITEGMVVFVAGDARYAFRGGEDGYTMLNYRPDASYYMLPGVEERPIEGVRWPGIAWVGDVIV